MPPAPMIAIPTTAGTGAEVTRNAVIAIPEANVKVSLRHRSMIPDSVIVDPILTLSTPPNITAATGLDALTQLIEAFCSNRSHPFTDALCRSGLTHLAHALEIAYHESDHLAARSTMAYAALLSGIALTHVGLGSVHGFAGPLGGRLGAAHGEICATLLPAAIQTNLQALHKRQPNHPAIEKYDEAAKAKRKHIIGEEKFAQEEKKATLQGLLEEKKRIKELMKAIQDEEGDESSSRSSTLKASRSSTMKADAAEDDDDDEDQK